MSSTSSRVTTHPQDQRPVIECRLLRLVRERDYFTSRNHEDIDAIMENIRKAHRGRNESGLEHSTIADLKQDLKDVANFKGRRAKAWLIMYCKQTQPPYNKLAEEEKQWLMRIAQKPKLAKSHVSQRGKRENNFSPLIEVGTGALIINDKALAEKTN